MTYDGYKLIVYPKAKVERLYNLREDPYELNDLASDPNQQPRITELRQRLRKLQQRYDDPL